MTERSHYHFSPAASKELPLTPQEAAYILNNLSSIESLNAGCGELELTPEMINAIQAALTPILIRIIESSRKIKR